MYLSMWGELLIFYILLFPYRINVDSSVFSKLNSDLSQAVYCDVRQLLGYIRDGHGGVFRRVALSGLIDSADRPHKQSQKLQTTRVIRFVTHVFLSFDFWHWILLIIIIVLKFSSVSVLYVGLFVSSM